jgi:hypothetical protein
MCIGIAIDAQLLTETFLSRFGLRSRMQSDLFNSPQELQFRYNDPIPQLPIKRTAESEWELVLWGNRDNPVSRLPRTGWAREESVLAGKWSGYQPEPVIIPAQRGCEKGVWFPITGGMRGLLVADEHRTPRVYMLTREATPEYAALTKHDRMPIWIEEQ